MIRLLRAEFTRLRSRRFTLLALLVVLLALAGLQLIVNFEVTPPTAAEQAQNQAAYEQAHRDWEANHESYERACRQTSQNPDDECVISEPQLSEFGGARSYSVAAGEVLTVAVYLTGLTAFVVAASFIGAEYSTGSIGNWLTFLPRRGLVFGAKLIVIVIFAAVTSALASALTLGGAAGLVRLHGGQVSGLTPLAQQAGRGTAFAVALAVVGFCAALVSRHTAAAVGVLLGYLFVWFVRLAALRTFSAAQEATRWSPEGNIQAIVNNGYTYLVPVRRLTAEGEVLDTVERSISLTQGVIYWSALLAVVVVGSLVVFRRRDVT
jgi:ABC-2 type transport system permease protein